MLANPPTVYSPIFDPAYFNNLNQIDGNFVLKTGDNVYDGTNTYNSIIALEPSQVSIGAGTLKLGPQGFDFVDPVATNPNTAWQQYNENGVYTNVTALAVGNNKALAVNVGGNQNQIINSDGLGIGIDLRALNVMNFNFTNLIESEFSGSWNIPTGGTCAYKEYTATTLPTSIYYQGQSAAPKCIWVPNASDVPRGTIFRVIATTNGLNNNCWLSIAGAETPTGNEVGNNLPNVFFFSTAIWPTVPTAGNYQERKMTQLEFNQTAAFISMDLRSPDRTVWATYL
jgi:hypothetical protein